MRDPEELVVVMVILGLFGALGAAGFYAAKARPRKLARLREAPEMSAESVSGARICAVLLAGTIVTGGSVPLLMAAFPRTPLMVLVSIVLAFAAVLAPLTFARRFTVDIRLSLTPRSLRLERRGAGPVVVDLARPFTLEARCVDDEVLVLVHQAAARILFSYRQGPAFVTLPLSPLPEGWVGEGERCTLLGEEAAILHERLRLLSSPAGYRTRLDRRSRSAPDGGACRSRLDPEHADEQIVDRDHGGDRCTTRGRFEHEPARARARPEVGGEPTAERRVVLERRGRAVVRLVELAAIGFGLGARSRVLGGVATQHRVGGREDRLQLALHA
ncbi:MAG: hypothetical protein QM820_36245 [Minicystis sp.]